MKNTIYTDADLNAQLLRGEEYDGNTIEIVIDADNTANQELTIAAGDASTTETITPGTRNTVEIPRMIWNFGGATTVTLSKNGTDAETITLTFPAAIDVDAGAALNETETANEYRMDGSQSLQQQITSLQEQLQTFSMQTIDYILPSAISQADIADGSSNTVLTFEISCDDEDARTAMLAEIQFLAETTVTGSTYGDLLLTASIALDGNAVGTLLKTYRDGRQVLKIDYLYENLTKGNHEMTVTLAAAGGGLSLMQIFSAFLLAAKSAGGSSRVVYPLFANGKFAAGVLVDGLNVDFLSEEAKNNGTINTVIKKSQSSGIIIPNPETLAAYFLSEYCLMYCISGATPMYMTENYITRDTNQVPPLDSAFHIPIKRVTGFTKLIYEGRIQNPSQSYAVLGVSAAAVINGQFEWAPYTFIYNNGTWETVEIDITSLPYVDYIRIYTSGGNPLYRNIRLVKE